MDYITIFFIAVSLAMDAFAVSIANGACVTNFCKKNAVQQGLYFGGFQFLMPLLGWLLGTSVKNYIEAVDHWIAFGLLALIGGNMILESIKKQEEEIECTVVLTTKNLILQAIATSIDALAVGISFAILDVHIVAAAAIIGIVAFIISYIGGILGTGLGQFLEKKTTFVGGLVLIAIGLKIVFEHTLTL